MMRLKFVYYLFAIAPLCLQALPAGAQDIGEPATEEGLADIVVTAQKREQRLQDVPVSVTALTASALQANRINNIRDLDAITPNLTVSTTGGGSALPTYSMRGLLTSGTAPGSDKGVAVYIDGVYLGSGSGSLFDLSDIARIEVLKGPQGTLFGRNSTGGAISITTRDPVGAFGATQELTYGNLGQFRARTRVELPRMGPLSALATYTHSEERGGIRNLGAGTVFDFGPGTGGGSNPFRSPKYLGSANTEAVTATVKLDASADLSLVYKFDYTANNYSPPGVGVTAILDRATGGLSAALLGSQPNLALLTPVSSRRPDAVNNAFTTNAKVRAQGHSLTGRYDITDQISIRNILAYRKSRYVNAGNQLDGLGGVANTLSSLGPVGAPFEFLVVSSAGHDSQWSNETQINITTDWFTLTAGLLHYQLKIEKGGFGSNANVLIFRTLPGNIVPDGNARATRVKTKSDAAFVQNEVHLTDALDLVLGARITRDRKDGQDNSIRGIVNMIRYRDSRPTYLAGLNYKPNSNILTYAKFSTGYISGGELATLTYNPETTHSYEGGIKADWLDRRLRTNLAVFYAKYTDIQFTGSGSTFGVPAAATVLVNAGDARAYGFEFESTLQPIRPLMLAANLGYTDFKYTRLDPRLVVSGSTIPSGRPKWTGQFSAQYETEPLFDDVTLALRADATYKSKFFGASSAPTPAILAATTVRNSWLLNMRATLAGFEVYGAKAEIAGWGRNILNNRKINRVENLGFVFPAIYERAPAYGVDLKVEL